MNASDGKFTMPIRYSNQDFDEKQARAAKLADDGRQAGTIPPGYGYTSETWAQACAEYKAAQDAYWRVSPTTVDVSVIKEYGLNQKLSNQVRVY